MAPFTAKTKLPASLGQTCYFRLSSSQFGLTFKLWWTKHPTPLSNAVLLHSSENFQSSFPCTNGVYDFNQPIIDQSTVQQRPSVMQRFSEKQLRTYLTENKLVNICQHDFLQINSCTTCTTVCLNAIKTAADAGRSVMMAYLETVYFWWILHQRLISKIKSCGIFGP